MSWVFIDTVDNIVSAISHAMPFHSTPLAELAPAFSSEVTRLVAYETIVGAGLPLVVASPSAAVSSTSVAVTKPYLAYMTIWGII